MDTGWWPMAWELPLEPEPPYAAITMRPQESQRMPRPAICEPRWAEVALSRLRDLDEYVERRKRLGYRAPRTGAPAVPANAGAGEAQQEAPLDPAARAAAKAAARAQAKQAARARAAAAAGGGQQPPR